MALPPGFVLEEPRINLPKGFVLETAPPPPEKQSAFRQIADVPLGIAKGAVQGVRMIADAFGAGSDTSKTIKGAETYLADLMSAQAKNDQQEISRIMKDAEDKGFLDQVKAGVKAFTVAPVDTLSSALGTAAPVIVGALGAKILGAGALATTGVSAMTGAGMGAGVVKGSIYEETKRALKEAGASEKDAEARAQLAQEYGGKNLDQILLGTVLGGAAAIGPLEKGAAGILARRILGKTEGTEAVAGQAVKGAARRRLEAGALEAVPEMVQAGQEQVAQNIALQREGFDVPTFRGAVSSATLEGLAGASLGAAIGAKEAAPKALTDREQAEQLQKEILADIERQRAMPPRTVPLTPEEEAELDRQRAVSERPKTTEELLTGIQTGKATTVEDVARIRDEHETAVIEGLLAQDAKMARANQFARRQLELESEAEATAGGISDVDARVRESRIFARVQDLIDRNIPFASTAINDINQKFGVINEFPLTEEERARIENIMGMVSTFTNFVNLPVLAPKPVDRFAENQAMEALIKERTERGQAQPLRTTPPAPSPRIEETTIGQGTGEGTAIRPTSGVEPSVAQDRELVAPTETPSAERTITEPSGTSVPMAGEPAANAPAAGVGTIESVGMVPSETDVGQLAGREEVQPGAVKTSLPEAARPAPIELTEKTKAKIGDLGSLLNKNLRQFNLQNVALNIEQDLLNNGEYSNRLIKLALNAESPVRDLRHESLHAMKELGFFTDAQWKTLEKMARDKWVDKYLKSRTTLHNGKQMSRYDAYMDLYQNEDHVLEEAIADAFGDFDKTKPPPGLMQALLKRMKNLFNGIRQAMGSANLESAEDIFEKVEQGKLKETGATESGVRASLREVKKPSTQEVSRIFERMVKFAEKELSSALFNWNDSRLNEDKDKIIVYPGRDQRFVRGKEGGKSNVTKSSFIEWLMSDAPFDTSVYGEEITNDAEWRNEVETLRKIVSPAEVVRPSLRTDTPEFRKWFGNSKVVDAEGKPLVVYHGTNQDFSAFDPEQSREGDEIIFVTPNRRVASDFSMYRTTWGGANVMPVYVKADRVLEVKGGGRNIRDVERDAKVEGMKDGETVRDYAAREGYDAIVFRDVRDPISPDIDPIDDVYALLPSAKIKSAIGNIGAYGQRPVTKQEASRFGMTEKEANEAQKRGDIRFSLRDSRLFHRSSMKELADIDVGEQFTLKPGPQGAEGRGVYFSQDTAVRPTTAEGAQRGQTAIVVIDTPARDGWFVSKLGKTEKFGKPRTWHTNGKDLELRVTDIDEVDGERVIYTATVSSWVKPVGAEKFSLRAYHGTPHRGIDKFSTEFIGSGEGNQAYGWGLYFASKKEIAEHYREALSSGYAPTIVKDGRELSGAADIAQAYYTVGRVFRGYGGNDVVLDFDRQGDYRWSVKVQEVDEDGKPKYGTRPRWHATMPEIRDLERVLGAQGYKIRRGQLYEVDIPEENEMLLWDKPLSEQPAKVRVAVKGLIDKLREDKSPFGDEVQFDLKKSIDAPSNLMEWKGFNVYKTMSSFLGSDKAASEMLLGAGVKGIKYLDGGSRSKGDGTYNYVVFSGEDIAVQKTFYSLRSYSLTNQGTPGEQALETVKAMGLESQPPEKTQIKQIFIDARKDPKAAKAQAKAGLQKFADTVETKIFSADSAWNNTVRRAVADDIKNAPEVIGTLLSNSTSQAVQADNVANRAIITGGMEYEEATKKFVAVDKKENFPAMMREIDKIAEKYGMTKEDAERVAHSYWIAKRLNSLDKTNDVLTADQIKLGLELKDKIPELDKVNDIWHGIRKNTIEQMVETGLWTPEYAQILWDNMDYVPFYREEQIEQSEGPKEFIKNLQVKAKEYKFKGSSKPVNDIFDNQIRWMQYALNRAIRNHKAVQMIDVGKSIVIDGKPMVAKVDEAKRGMNTTKVYRNGVEEIYDVGLPGFVEAFAGVSNVADPVLKGFAKFADMLRKTVVLYPLFTVSQLSQDSIAAIFTSGLGPRYALKIPFLAVKEFVTNLKKDRGDAFKALQNYGVTGVRDYSSTVARENTEIFAGVKEDRGVYKKAMAYLGDFAMSGDNAVRQAVYKASLDQGLSKAEAIEKSLEIFNVRRRGTLPLVNILGQTVPFFYAFLAAQRVAYRTLTGVGTSPTAREAALTTLAQTTLAVMALSTIYAMAASGDDDYEKTPDALRDRTIAIPGTGMRIPLRPDFFLFPKIIAERTYRIMAEQGTEDPAKFYEAMRSNLASSLLSPTPVPQVLKPLVEINLNYDFFKQKPIISTYDKMKEADRQFNDSTSELAKLFGNIGISPINMDHFIRGTFGSAGGAVLWGTNFLLHNDPNVPRPELTFQEAMEALPGTSVFRSKANESSLKADFYKLKEEIDKAKVTYDDIKLRSPQDLEQFLSDEKTIARLSLEKPVRDMAEQLSKIRGAIAQVSNAPESIYSASDKRDYIKQLKEVETEMLKSIDVKGLMEMAKM